jgi:hypothetical protein
MKITPEEREEIEASTPTNREKAEVVSFGGIARTESGKLTRSNYFRFLNHNLDDYTDLEFTPEQAQKVHSHLLKLSTGASAMTPMYCGGDMCPFKERCVFWQMGKAPIGKQCLVEVELMKTWVTDYMEEFDVDPNVSTEVAYVNELAELQILEMRINMNLSKAVNAELIVENTIGVDRDGDPIMQKQISPFMEMKERIANRRSKIIKLMVGDRQEKYKKEAALKVKLEDDPSSKMAHMRTKLEGLSRQLQGMEEVASTTGMSPEDLMNDS